MYNVHISNMSTARNRGSEALVLSLLANIEAMIEPSKVAMFLHTEDPDYDSDVFAGHFLRVYRGYPSYLPLHTHTPWINGLTYGSLAMLERLYAKLKNPGSRLATLSSLKKADLIVATGGDIFTSDYNNFHYPAFVFNLGRPVALIAQTIGPFKKADEDYFKIISKTVKLLTVRESESFEYIKSIYPELNPKLTADVAFLLPVAPCEESLRIVEEEHHFPTEGRDLVGISVSQGVLAYQSKMGRGRYVEEFAAFIDDLNVAGKSAVIIPHVQETVTRNNDVYACLEVFRKLRRRKDNVVLMSPLSSIQYKGIIGLCSALIGVRTHPTIASLSQGIPTVAVAYSRKARGIMRDYYGRELGDKLTIDVAQLSRDGLNEAYAAAVARGSMLEQAAEMKERARKNFVELAKILPDRIKKSSAL